MQAFWVHWPAFAATLALLCGALTALVIKDSSRVRKPARLTPEHTCQAVRKSRLFLGLATAPLFFLMLRYRDLAAIFTIISTPACCREHLRCIGDGGMLFFPHLVLLPGRDLDFRSNCPRSGPASPFRSWHFGSLVPSPDTLL